MPVTPDQARKMSVLREEILRKVDEAIFAAYAKSKNDPKVSIPISREWYEMDSFVSWLIDQYTRAGWSVNFVKAADTRFMTMIIEKASEP